MSPQRVAVVTGGLGGIGTAICRHLAQAGCRVIAADLDGPPERRAAFGEAMQGLDAETAVLDVSDFDACARFVANVEERHGTLDIVVNNAGITRDTTLRKMERVQWEAVIDVNLGSVFNLCRHAVDGMVTRGFGRIVNLASVNGQTGQFGQTNYSAAKAGMHGFTKALAQEVARKGVTVNTVSPGYLATKMVTAVPPDVLQQIVAGIPVGRLGQPAEIAALVSFIASEAAAFMTGSNVSMNGGQYMA